MSDAYLYDYIWDPAQVDIDQLMCIQSLLINKKRVYIYICVYIYIYR